jgi:hypothetical protein
LEHITLWNLLAILFIALGAGFVQSSIGFGFAIIALPFIVMILPLKQSVAILSILGTLCYIRNTYKLRKDIDMKIVMIPLVASMAGRVLGMQFLMGSEGTRQNQHVGEELKPKSGAAFIAYKAGVNILPVYITPNHRPFSTVHIVIGKPFAIEREKNHENGNGAALKENARYIMDRIYALKENII